MTAAVIRRLIQDASEKAEEAREIILQTPDDLGGISRDALYAVISAVESALKADAYSLRGDIGAARALIRRYRFPRAENVRLFSILADIGYALEDIDEAAAVLKYPASEVERSIPAQLVVSRQPIERELDLLRTSLAQVDVKLAELIDSKAKTLKFSRQDMLIDFVATHAGAKSELAHQIAAERKVDIRSLSHVVQGLHRLIEAFCETVDAPTARVTDATKAQSNSLAEVGEQVLSAGTTTLAAAIKSADSSMLRTESSSISSIALERDQHDVNDDDLVYITDQRHLFYVLQARGHLRACDMTGLTIRGVNLSGKDLTGSNWLEATLEDVDLSGANLRGANFERAELTVVDLARANLWGANFWRSVFQRTDIEAAVLMHTNFWHQEGIVISEKNEDKIISFSNYVDFFRYFERDILMPWEEIRRTFAWINSDQFDDAYAITKYRK